MRVPPLDLPAQYAGLKEEIDRAIERACENAWFKLGPEVERFERDWAERCGAEHCVAVNSGTSALHLALEAVGVGEGDEVITSPLSFFATAEAILYTGARPVFADIEPETFNLDPDALEPLVTDATRAVMPVHLFGHPADMDPILRIAEEHGLAVVEDAAQAHGALYRGRPVGAIGHAGAFSFYVTKNLGAFGEGGAVVTDDADLAETMRLLRNHGQSGGYFHSMVGYNYRMAGLQGAVLNVKLPHLEEWNARRREIAERYSDALADTPLTLPTEADYARSSWHLYVVRCPDRDALKEHLQEAGISAGIHYPVPLPDLAALSGRELRETPIPQTRRACAEVLTLPLFPEMTDAQQDYVLEKVTDFFD
ncbi:MAG: DegT/DnrJ/EryC1/StrS family aminotransferase [Candidatus Brocadiia bacterium]